MRKQKLFLLIFLSITLYSAAFGRTIFNEGEKSTYKVQSFIITDYGAVGDGKTICTEFINHAIKECYKNGGGQVYFPPGIYISGTIILKSNVELYLERGSTLLASTNHSDFPRMKQPKYRSQKDPGGWYALIYGEGVSNIGIRGFGLINGQGKLQKSRPELLGGDRDGRPRNILLISCSDVRIENVKMKNSGIWNQHYLNCEDVIIDGVQVYNHSNRNNDAIDIDGCRRFVMSNSIVDSDDDGITLKSTGAALCEDITISNCVVSSFCNGIKAGTESTGGFKNITISNCIIKPSRSKEIVRVNNYSLGITGISLEIVDGGIMEGVTIDNVTIEGTQCPLYIRLGNRARKHTSNAKEPGVGIMKNIAISNLVAYNSGNFCSSITSFTGHYIENVSLNNIQLFNIGGLQKGDYIADINEIKEDEKGYPQPTNWKELPSSALFIRHAKNVMIQGLLMGSDAIDPRVPIIANDVEGLSIKNTRVTKNNTSDTFFQGKDVTVFDVEKPLGWKAKVTNIQ